jgi:hypothetical protein
MVTRDLDSVVWALAVAIAALAFQRGSLVGRHRRDAPETPIESSINREGGEP